jgi:hypothetical protein
MVLMKSTEQPMKKPLTSADFALATPPVTKRQRLQRFADVIRSGPPCPVHLFINLEYRDAGEWKYLSHPGSPFARAAQDNVLYAAGLRSGSVCDAQRFFELSREELTEFSCVCGGSIDSHEMAQRIERIAGSAS